MMVIVNRHPIYSALYLVLTFLGLSVFFLQLQAPFLAAVQVIVYAGAIMVLFVFVIMLLGEDKPIAGEQKLGIPAPLGVLFALILVGEIGYMLARVPPAPAEQLALDRNLPPIALVSARGQTPPLVSFGSVQAIGNTLFTNYLFAFEATSIVLLIAMVGVVVLAKRRL